MTGPHLQHAAEPGDTAGVVAAVSRMPAIVQDRYGKEAEAVLRLEEIDRPEVGDDDVLLRIGAATVHIGDWHLMTGQPYLMRAIGFGLRKPKTRVRGTDVAGTVEAVGRNVTRFQVGDEVFGTCDGSFAAYATARADTLAPKPASLTFKQAAALPTSGCTALQALRAGQIAPGRRVLIIGASGGVGAFAVQIAKAFGAVVTGVCGPAKVDMVHALGADVVLDYTRDALLQGGRPYDLILVMGGNRSLSGLRRALAPKGTLVLVGGEGGGRFIGGALGRSLRALVLSPFVSQNLRMVVAAARSADLQFLTELVDAGKVVPVIDRTYPLSEVPDAFRYLSTGLARGKIIISI